MPYIKATITAADMLQAVEQFDEAELDTFVLHVIAVQAKRKSSRPAATEAALTQMIITPLPESVERRYYELIELRRAERLSEAEYAELLQLTDQVEDYQAARLGWLVQLAQLRHTSLEDVMASLGIVTPPYE